MRAIVYEKPGDEITYKEVEKPEPKEGEVLVRVAATSVNHVDIWGRTGLKGVELPFPRIPGSDVVGYVEKPLCKKFAPGDRVIAYPLITCNSCEFCISGRENLCQHLKLIGFHTDGGYAEYVNLPSHALLKVTDDVRLEDLAAIPVAYITAWNSLINAAKLSPGESFLIIGGGSGVGTAAIQIAKLVGANIIASAGHDWKLKRLNELGIEQTINHSKEDIFEKVMEYTEGRGVDVVLEQVGEATFVTSLKCLARGGRLITMGSTTGRNASIDIRYIFSRNLSIKGVYLGSKGDLISLVKLVAQRKIKPIIDSVFPLERAVEAQRKMEERNIFGKILIKP